MDSLPATPGAPNPQHTTEATQPPRDPSHQLKDLFPDIDSDIIQAVLAANNGDVDASVNSLLGMSDPNYKTDPNEISHSTVRNTDQEEQDAALARQLAAEEDARFRQSQSPQLQRQSSGNQQRPVGQVDPRYGRPQGPNEGQRQGQGGGFMQEEFPQIKENVTQALNVTKTKMSEWYKQIRERVDAATTDKPVGQQSNSQYHSESRYENPAFQYHEQDHDNQMIGEDFSNLRLYDSSEPRPVAPPQPPRPQPSGNSGARPYDVSTPTPASRPVARSDLLSSTPSANYGKSKPDSLANLKAEAAAMAAESDAQESTKAANAAFATPIKTAEETKGTDSFTTPVASAVPHDTSNSSAAPAIAESEEQSSIEKLQNQDRIKNPFEEDEDFKTDDPNLQTSNLPKEALKNPFEEDDKL